MTPQDLIAAFEVLADAPDGVKRLRELVLHIAVRGKLVPQDPNDEPASHFLALVAETKRNAGSGKSRRHGWDLIGSTPWELPPGWAWAPFGDTNVNRDGERVPVSSEERQGRVGPYDYYGASGVIGTIDGFLFDKPLLLIGEDGANLVLRSTPIAFIARGKYWVNNHAHVLDGVDEGSLRYLAIFINSIDLRPFLTGMAQPKLNQARMNVIPCAVPPLAEQHRIVARVDELMGLLDRLEAARATRDAVRRAARDAALANLRDAPDAEAVETAWSRISANIHDLFTEPEDVAPLRQAVLELAVRGRLVKQDPGDEPAGKLAEQVAAERARCRGRASKAGDAEPVDAPFAVPPSWEWVRFGDLFECRLGKMLDKAKNKGTPRPYLRNANVRWGAFDLSDVLEMRLEDHDLAEVTVQKGDLVICEGGEPGRAAVWESAEPFVIQKALHRARPYLVDSHYYQLHLAMDCGSGRLAELFTGATIKHFTGQVLDKLPVTLPPLAEQHRIVAKVDVLMALCDDLEARLTGSRHLHAQFAAAAVHRLES